MEGCLDETLGYAICAMSLLSLFRDYQLKERSASWIRLVGQSILDQLERPTLFRVQALILCVAYHMETGCFQRAFMLAGLAARGATTMRLNYEAQNNDSVLCESRRRTVWSLKVLEVYFSIGLPENELIPFENVFLQFPVDEAGFQGPTSSASLKG
jgi:hypothetical protein